MVIGLTGKSCAGKDAVALMLKGKGLFVIDVDALGHDSLEENKEELRGVFGDGIIGKDGTVDRKVLGPIVFSSKEKLERLNSITHPWMVRKTEELAKGHGNSVVNAAILEKMGLDRICDEIILVWAPLEVRIERAVSRDGITREKFLDRDKSQGDLGVSLFSLEKPVFTIINDKGRDVLCRQVEAYCDRLKRRGIL